MPNIGKIPVYCHMSNSGLGECGGGGWTLVMKIDGTQVPLQIASTPSFARSRFSLHCFLAGLFSYFPLTCGFVI